MLKLHNACRIIHVEYIFNYKPSYTIIGTCYLNLEYFFSEYYSVVSSEICVKKCNYCKRCSVLPALACFVSGMKPHLLLISLLQQLHVAASLAVTFSQGGAPMFRQVRGRRYTPTLRVNPRINMVGDIATRNPSH